jgi:hypothetical protein
MRSPYTDGSENVVRQVLHSARELVRNAKEKRLKLEILR